MSQLEKLGAVMSNPVMRQAYLSACKYRGLEYKGHGQMYVGGKRVGHLKWNCTQKLIASIVYDNHNGNT